jgi:hypothetical protein
MGPFYSKSPNKVLAEKACTQARIPGPGMEA